MKLVALRFTTKELELLTTLFADQLFRKEFIDPRFPGHKSDPEEIKLGKSLIGRLRSKLDPGAEKRIANQKATERAVEQSNRSR